MAVARAVAGDQLGVVEVVAGVEPDALGQAGAERLLVRLVEQRDLDAVDLGGVRLDDREHGVGGGVDVARAPVAFERRIEHVAEPVQDDRRLGLLEQPSVDAGVGVGVRADGGKRPRRHQDHLAARRLDRLHLLGIGGDQPRLVPDLARRPLVGAGAAGDARLHRMRLRLAHGALDQLLGGQPVDAHAALRRVHRLGEAEALVPEPAPEAERVLPVHRRAAHPGVALGDRVGHHVRRGEGGAGQRHPRRARASAGRPRGA